MLSSIANVRMRSVKKGKLSLLFLLFCTPFLAWGQRSGVLQASIDDIVRTPTTHPEDFVPIKKSRNLKNINTDEVWSKSFTNHSHSNGGEWKVGLGKSSPTKNKKITVSEKGRIIKIDR